MYTSLTLNVFSIVIIHILNRNFEFGQTLHLKRIIKDNSRQSITTS